MKKNIPAPKRSISTLLAITLSLNSFYVFGMQRKYSETDFCPAETTMNLEELEEIVQKPGEIRILIGNRRQEGVVADSIEHTRSSIAFLPSIFSGVRNYLSQPKKTQPRDDLLDDEPELRLENIEEEPAIEAYLGGKKLLDIPDDTQGVIFEFLADNWNDMIKFMAQNTHFYLVGLESLKRLTKNKKVNIRVSTRELDPKGIERLIDHFKKNERGLHKDGIFFENENHLINPLKIGASKSKIYTRNNLKVATAKVQKKFFLNEEINSKVARKQNKTEIYISEYLVPEINKNIEESFNIILVNEETDYEREVDRETLNKISNQASEEVRGERCFKLACPCCVCCLAGTITGIIFALT